MPTTTAAELDLVAELRALWARVPAPRERWHPWADVIARLHADVQTALAVLDADEDARRALGRLVAGEAADAAAGLADELAAQRVPASSPAGS